MGLRLSSALSYPLPQEARVSESAAAESPALAPSERVRRDRRPGERQCGSRAQALGIAANDARPQRQSARLADHQDGIAVVDDVGDDEIDRIAGAVALAGRAQPQAF